MIHTTKGPTIYGTGYWYREVARQQAFAGVAGNTQIYDLPSNGTVFAVILQEVVAAIAGGYALLFTRVILPLCTQTVMRTVTARLTHLLYSYYKS